MLGGRGAIRDEQYKIVVGRCCPEGYPGLCQRGGPRSPNASTHMNTTDVDCTEGPCVFDLKVMRAVFDDCICPSHSVVVCLPPWV